MKKKIIFLVMILVIIISCDRSTPTNPGTLNWRTGSQGLIAYFEVNQPPATIYSDQGFMATIRLENKGAFDVGGPFDRVYLSGFDPNMIIGLPSQGIQIPKIQGKTKYDSQGGKDWIAFKGDIYLPQGIDSHPTDLQLTTCYKYETLASGNVCIDPNPFSTARRQKTCMPGSTSLGTQGAPISVSSIKTEAAPQKTRFEITIANSGAGIALKENGDALKRCSPHDVEGLKFEDIDFIRITDVKIGEISIQPCKNVNNGYLRLVNGKGIMYCEMATTGTTEYTSNIQIILSYGYQETIKKSIQIINVNN